MKFIFKITIKNILNSLVSEEAKGFFNDDYWSGVTDVFDVIREVGFDLETNVENGGYSPDRNSKRWKLVTKIKDTNGKEVKLYGVLVASACGTVDEPWNKYDIVCYFN